MMTVYQNIIFSSPAFISDFGYIILPDNINVNINGLMVTFVPDLNFFGLRTATVTASDGLCSSGPSNIFQLNVTPVNDLPVVNIPTLTFAEDSAGTTINLDSYITDPDTPPANILWTHIGGDTNINVNINQGTRQATFTSVHSELPGLFSERAV